MQLTYQIEMTIVLCLYRCKLRKLNNYFNISHITKISNVLPIDINKYFEYLKEPVI